MSKYIDQDQIKVLKAEIKAMAQYLSDTKPKPIKPKQLTRILCCQLGINSLNELKRVEYYDTYCKIQDIAI